MWMTSKWLDTRGRKLMKAFDLEEPTSFLDHAHCGCTQRECKPNEKLLNNIRRCLNHVLRLEQQKITGLAETSRTKISLLSRYERTCSKIHLETST